MRPPYEKLIYDIYHHGHQIGSRHGPCREVLGSGVYFKAGEMVTRKGMNDALGFMELMQIVAGVFDPDEIIRVAPKAQAELFTAQMAYGPRITDQIPRLIDKLESDPETRQAVLFIAKPEDGPTENQPCTTTMQFLIRDGRLYAITSMRSWDAVKGLTYDVMFQGGLVLLLARVLGQLPGSIVCTAGSLHLYDSDLKRSPSDKVRYFDLGEPVPYTWGAIQTWAQQQVYLMDKIPFGIEVRS